MVRVGPVRRRGSRMCYIRGNVGNQEMIVTGERRSFYVRVLGVLS